MPIPDIVVDNPTVDAQWWIKAAQGSIRRYCGWHVTPEIDDTLKVDAYGGSILTLPTKHVTPSRASSWTGASSPIRLIGAWPVRSS